MKRNTFYIQAAEISSDPAVRVAEMMLIQILAW
jgi:hypothetical protein